MVYFLLFGLWMAWANAAEPNPQSVLIRACAGCHAPNSEGALSRIRDMRKTPEGWDMTIVRMGVWHDVKTDANDRKVLVKYLADTQGLAPEETTDYRYLLERRPNVPHTSADEELGVMCARCHSYGRIALQRRDEAEWRKLAHTHLGQFPSAEYQNYGRDRKWWEIARDQMPPKLASLYPLKTAAWEQWKSHKLVDPAGTWRVSGERPGGGRYTGYLKIQSLGHDNFEADYTLSYANGSQVNGQGKAVLYTGYEWRGAGKLGSDEVLSVYALSADGNRLSGRWFLKGAEEIGADLTAVRVKEGESGIVAVEPPFLRAGQKAQVTIYGYGLAGDVKFDKGLDVKRVVKAEPDQVTVEVQASDKLTPGKRPVNVGKTKAEAAMAVYKTIDAIRVEPEFAIARIGGGEIAPVSAQLQAIAYLNGPDGKAGTKDDVRLGTLPAQWAVANFSEVAAAMEDARFAGKISEAGLFIPGPGGPNPVRKFGTDNTGDLKITAKVKDGNQTLAGDGHLIVTVQRWNTPPLR